MIRKVRLTCCNNKLSRRRYVDCNPILEVRGLLKSIHSGTHRVDILRGISFAVERVNSLRSWGLRGAARAPCLAFSRARFPFSREGHS